MENESYIDEGSPHPTFTIALCGLAAALAAALLCGDVSVSPVEAARILIAGPFAETEEAFKMYAVWGLRLPRALCSALSGAILCLGGHLLQRATGQPALDPFTVGATPGAVFGIFCLQMVRNRWLLAVPLIAGLGVPFVVWTIGDGLSRWRDRDKFTLIGFTFGSLLLAATAAARVFLDRDTSAALPLMIGSFHLAGWFDTLPLTLALCLLMLICSMQQDNLRLLGSAPRGKVRERARAVISLFACIAASIAASRFGALPMIGFMIPYAADRILPGHRQHAALLSPIVGAATLTLLDTVCRVHGEIPAGAVALALGLPLFIMAILREDAKKNSESDIPGE